MPGYRRIADHIRPQRDRVRCFQRPEQLQGADPVCGTDTP